MGRALSVFKWVAGVSGAGMIAAAQTKPEDAKSNIAGWLELMGFDNASLLNSAQVDTWFTAIGIGFILLATVLATKRWWLKGSPLLKVELNDITWGQHISTTPRQLSAGLVSVTNTGDLPVSIPNWEMKIIRNGEEFNMELVSFNPPLDLHIPPNHVRTLSNENSIQERTFTPIQSGAIARGQISGLAPDGFIMQQGDVIRVIAEDVHERKYKTQRSVSVGYDDLGHFPGFGP